jgi:hypothetical protein
MSNDPIFNWDLGLGHWDLDEGLGHSRPRNSFDITRQICLRWEPANRFGTSPFSHAKEPLMRVLLNVTIPNSNFNAAIKDGSAGRKLKKILEVINPEAVYFTEQDGQRGAVLVVEMADASQIPALAEPWFLTFDADVEFRIAMTPADLEKAGLDKIGKQWG